MFSAFEGPPRIARLFGKGAPFRCMYRDHIRSYYGWTPGTAYEFGTPEYEALLPPEKRKFGSRAAIVVDVQKVSTVRIIRLSSYFSTGKLTWLGTVVRLRGAIL